MVYTSNRNVVKNELSQTAWATCTECAWNADDPALVRSLSVEHVRKTKHKVQVELRSSVEYEVEGKGY